MSANVRGMVVPRSKVMENDLERPRAWLPIAARAGFLAQALVYGTIGVLAGLYALGIGGRTTDARGAIVAFGESGYGGVLLTLAAIGFAGYSVWRFIQAIADTEEKGNDVKGIAVRIGYFCAGVVNAWLAVVAVRVLVGERMRDGDSARGWTAELLQLPFGDALAVVAGVGVVVFGLAQFKRAFDNEYREHLALERMNGDQKTMARHVSRTGLSTRGAIYVLAGIFLISAAVNADPSEAHDPGGVLRFASGEPVLLGLLALGMLAYAGYAAFEAAYRRL